MKRRFAFAACSLFLWLVPGLSYADAPAPAATPALADTLVSWAPLLLIVILWVFAASRMSGGKFGRRWQVQEDLLKATQENLEIQKQILDILRRR